MLGISSATSQWTEDVLERLKADMASFEEIGAREADASRQVASVAITDVYDAVLQSLAQNPELQQLVQQQGIGLTSSVVEEVRQRTVGGDLMVDRIARRILRLKPTEPAPPHVKAAARSEDLVKKPEN
jgi:hypothetical protein